MVACEDCLEVCFVRLVVERIFVWCLVIAAIFIGFGQEGAKMCGGCLKVINWGWRCKSQKGVYTVTGFIGYLSSLLFYVFEVGKAKSAAQSVLMKH